MTRRTISIPKEQDEELKKFCKSRDLKISPTIRNALKDYMRKSELKDLAYLNENHGGE